jgi:hypothetical protein
MHARNLIVLLTAAACTACASSNLKIQVALYDGDPHVTFSVTGVQKVLAQLTPMEREIRNVAEARKALAKAAVDLEPAYYDAWPETKGSPDLTAGVRMQLPEFVAVVDDTVQLFSLDVAAARSSGESYLDARNRTATQEAETAFRRDIARVDAGYRRLLASPLGGHAKNFEQGFLHLLPEKFETLSGVPDETKRKTLHESLQYIIDELHKLPNHGYDAIRRFEESVRAMTGASDSAKLNAASNSALVALTGGLATSDSQLDELQSRVLEATIGAALVDRIQDAADPVWRQVAAPENEKHWNMRFEESYAYAQGNSSVVIVQDSPLSYRVQRSSNDPRALVAGQLAVTRAIASAAIEVASAAAGLPGKPLGTQSSPGTSSAVESTKLPSVNVTRARLASESRGRAKARAAVLSAVDGVDAKLNALVQPALSDNSDDAAKRRFAAESAAYLAKVEAFREELKSRLDGAVSGFPNEQDTSSEEKSDGK